MNTERGDEGTSPFGSYIKYVRKEVFDESLRVFGKRVGISPSYLNKIELGQVGVPRRDTVEQIASKLPGVDSGVLMQKAGFIPEVPSSEMRADLLAMKVDRIAADQRAVLMDIIDMFAMKYPRK